MDGNKGKVYECIALAAHAMERCKVSKNARWKEIWEDRLEALEKHLPSGSGFDNGTKIVSATEDCIVLSTAFHHMDDNGYYCGWSEHTIRVRASLVYGFTLSIGGRDVRQVKDYIDEAFRDALDRAWEFAPAPPLPAPESAS